MHEVIFYKTDNGDCLIEKFVDSLSAKQAQKILWVLNFVEDLEFAPPQYFKKLKGTDDIWEIKIDVGRDVFRLLGFFDKGNLIILANGFAKKTKKSATTEIDLAEKRKKGLSKSK